MTTIKDTLKQWFKNGKKPDEQQFWAWLDSYWHKEDKIPIEVIEDINTILANKADTQLVNNLLTKIEGKADKSLVDALRVYVYGLIDDSLTQASDKTYSINKINEITRGYITDAVTDVSYEAKTGKLIIEYENEDNKEINLPKDNFLSDVNYDSKTKEIIFTMSNGTTFKVNVAELVDTYEAAPNKGLELINSNQFAIKEKGVTENMLSDEVQEKLKKNNSLQEVTDKGNTTDKDLITNDAVLGRDSKNDNLKFGKDALKNIQDGKNNTAIGDNALSMNENSPDNTAVGYNALSQLKLKDSNTAVGTDAGKSITESENSTLVGAGIAPNVTKLDKDTFIGAYVANKWKGGTYQMITNPNITHEAGDNVAVGNFAMQNTFRGKGNTVIGSEAGYNFANYGDYNTMIGYKIAGYREGVYAGDCSVFIGANCPTRYFLDDGTDGTYSSYRLAIHAQPPTAEGGGNGRADPLILGDFKERWFTISGTWKLHPKYVLDADKDNTFTPVKMLVADDKGNVGVKNINDGNYVSTNYATPSSANGFDKDLNEIPKGSYVAALGVSTKNSPTNTPSGFLSFGNQLGTQILGNRYTSEIFVRNFLNDKYTPWAKLAIDSTVRANLNFDNISCIECEFVDNQENRLDINFITQGKDFKDFSLCVFNSSSKLVVSFSTINKIGDVIIDLNEAKDKIRIYLPSLGLGLATIKVTAESRGKYLKPKVSLMDRDASWAKYSKTINISKE
jgi:uncharacterized protein YlzI (FlbEa/FlbD family)